MIMVLRGGSGVVVGEPDIQDGWHAGVTAFTAWESAAGGWAGSVTRSPKHPLAAASAA